MGIDLSLSPCWISRDGSWSVSADAGGRGRGHRNLSRLHPEGGRLNSSQLKRQIRGGKASFSLCVYHVSHSLHV